MLKAYQQDGQPNRTNMSEFSDYDILKLMAQMEPWRAISYVETNTFEDEWYPDMIRLRAVSHLKEAYALLVDTVESGSRTSLSVNTPVATAVGLLPIVERIDSTLVREYFWRSMSLRKSATFGNMSMALGRTGDGNSMRLADPVLAA